MEYLTILQKKNIHTLYCIHIKSLHFKAVWGLNHSFHIGLKKNIISTILYILG